MENHRKVSDFVFDNVVIDILDRPTVPYSPSNEITLPLAKEQSAMIGALLAIVLIAVFSVLRDTIKTEESLKYYLDTRLLITIRHEMKNKTIKSRLKNINRSLLITNPVIGFSFSESIKRLCTKLEHIKTLRKHVVFLVTSACENEGKSTISANLALGLAKCGYKVLLMDCDLHKPALYKLFDINPEPMAEFSKCLGRKASIDEVVIQDGKTGLYLLVNRSSCHNSADLLSSLQMERVLNYFRNQMDYIIIDSPPMSVISDTEVLVSHCDASLLVVRQDYAFVKVINDTIDKLQVSSDFLGCIYNNTREIDFHVSDNYERMYGKYYKKVG
jgi:capsular exopolysaccharide synthesis family protein